MFEQAENFKKHCVYFENIRIMKLVTDFLTPLSEEEYSSNKSPYGFLAIAIALVAVHVVMGYNKGSYEHSEFILPIIFLTSHVAFKFRFGEKLTIILRVITLLYAVIAIPMLITHWLS